MEISRALAPSPPRDWPLAAARCPFMLPWLELSWWRAVEPKRSPGPKLRPDEVTHGEMA
jgi:hypothetical protein